MKIASMTLGKITKKILFASLLGVLSAGAAQASVTVGTSGGGNCYPYSCLAQQAGTEYQQVFTSADFSGAGIINDISVYQNSGGTMDSATYTLYLSTTSKSVMGLDSSNPANNIGADNKLFGTFTLGGNMPDVLTFSGAGFSYNSAMGNLLLDVVISNLTSGLNTGYHSFFDADYTGMDTSRLYAYQNGGTGQGSGGLVTTFDFVPNAVPEPASLALLGLGLAGLFASRRKAKQAR